MSETSDDRVKTYTDKHVFTHTLLTIETADVFREECFNTIQLNVLPILTVSLSVEQFMIMVLFQKKGSSFFQDFNNSQIDYFHGNFHLGLQLQ